MTPSLKQLEPDPDKLLSLDVEELAGILLVHLNGADSDGRGPWPGYINQTAFFTAHSSAGPFGNQDYGNRQLDVRDALREAWAWLEHQGLLVQDPLKPADIFVVSRRGQQIKSLQDFKELRRQKSTIINTMPSLTPAKKEIIANTVAQVRGFRFCGPSDDPDEQTAVTAGYRHLVIQLQRLAGPLLSGDAADRLNALEVEINNLYSAYDASSELQALLPDIEAAMEAASEVEKRSTMSAKPMPVPVCSIVGSVLGGFVYHHKSLESLFYQAGAVGEVPSGNCVVKCQDWLKRMHTEVNDPIAVLGKVIEEFMEVDRPYQLEDQQAGRKRINEVLARFGLSYHQGGLVLGAANALPTKSLKQVLQDRDLAGVDKEFERAMANVEKDPPAAITAACSILEALFKVYIEDTGIEMPADQSLKPLWKAASKHLGLDPAAIEDDDVKKVLSGLNSVVDGIGSLRTHTGSAHGHGRRIYRLQTRHARLAIHASHTLVGFFIETWDERRTKQA
jgi:hypothetical protein